MNRVENFFDRFEAGFDRAVASLSKRWRWFDHTWQALERFNDVSGARLAAAISYYGFFAAFSLVVLVYSILGRVLGTDDGGFVGTVNDYLTSQLNWVEQTASKAGGEQVTAIGAVVLVITGIGWIDSLRSSTRAVWHLDQHPGHWIVRFLVDGVMLVLLGVLLALSLVTSWLIGLLIDWIAGPATGAFGDAVLRLSGPVLEFAVNLMLSAAILTVVPRLRLSARRLIPTAFVVAIGIQLLNTIGRWYIAQLDHRPAYQLATGTVGLLVYLYLLNHLFLIGSALAATANRGSMIDLSGAGPPPVAVDNSGEPRGDQPSEPR